MMLTMQKKTYGCDVQDSCWSREEKQLWLGSLLCGCTMLYAARMVMPVSVVTISQEFFWDKTDSGAVLSAFFWGYMMTQVLGGYISDRIGGDKVLTMAAFGWALLTICTPRFLYISSSKSTTLTIVVVSRVLMGCLQGVHYPSMTSILSNNLHADSRSFGYAFATSGSHLGTLFCGSVGSYLLEHWGWQCPFYAIGIMALGWVILFRFCLIARHERKGKLIPVDTISLMPTSKERAPVPWLVLAKSASFWSILIAHLCGNNAFFILLSWLPTYFKESFPDAKGWVFNVLPWLVAIPSALFSGWLADYLLAKDYQPTFIRKLMEAIAMGGMSFFLLAVSYVQHYHVALFCMAAAMACRGFHSSGVLVNIQDIAPKHSGAVFGVMNTIGAIPGVFGVYIVGYILETTQSWVVVFSQTSVICFVGLTVYIIFGSARKLI